MHERGQMAQTTGERIVFLDPEPRADFLRIDNTTLSPGEVAERIVSHFSLPRGTPPARRDAGA